jgi:hypothetical protein
MKNMLPEVIDRYHLNAQIQYKIQENAPNQNDVRSEPFFVAQLSHSKLLKNGKD